jgi:transcriptional regulator with XRE-family HTH domain
MHRESLASHLLALRRKSGLSLADLGRETGISSSFLSLVEQGRSDITIGRLIRLADFYGVELADLVAGGHTEPATHVQLLKAGSGDNLHSEQEGVDLYDLSAGSRWALVPMLGVHQPGGTVAVDDPEEHETLLFVVEGTFELVFAGEPAVRLTRGEGAIYRSTGPYIFTNVGDVPGSVLAVHVDPRAVSDERRAPARRKTPLSASVPTAKRRSRRRESA